MKTTELRMSPAGFQLFKKYHNALFALECDYAVNEFNNYVVDIELLNKLNESLRRLAMTLEYIVANEVSEVEVESPSGIESK